MGSNYRSICHGGRCHHPKYSGRDDDRERRGEIFKGKLVLEEFSRFSDARFHLRISRRIEEITRPSGTWQSYEARQGMSSGSLRNIPDGHLLPGKRIFAFVLYSRYSIFSQHLCFLTSSLLPSNFHFSSFVYSFYPLAETVATFPTISFL